MGRRPGSDLRVDQFYQVARYGEFRASPDGDLILTVMRDANLASITAPVHPVGNVPANK